MLPHSVPQTSRKSRQPGPLHVALLESLASSVQVERNGARRDRGNAPGSLQRARPVDPKAAAESMTESVAIRKGPFLAEAQAEESSRARLAAAWPQLLSDGRVPRLAHDPLLVALARAADAGERPGPAIAFLEEARTRLKSE